MKRAKRFLRVAGTVSCFFLIVPLEAAVSPPAEKGVPVTVEGTVKFNVPYPQLLDGSRKTVGKLVEKTPAGSGMHLKYDNGSEADLSVSGEKLSIRFSGLADTVKFFKMEIGLGFSPLLGAKWKTDGMDYQPFPEQKPDKPHLLQANQKSFDLFYVTGEKIGIRLPNSTFAQLTDFREWNQKKFMLTCVVPIIKGAASYDFVFHEEAAPSSAGGEAPKKFLIDKFGQYTLKDWPLKVKSEEELKADLESDKAYYAGLNPPAFDKYGGLPGSREKYGFKQSGFFHLEKKGDRWYLVDPEGNWFFHLGICSFQAYTNSTYYKGREKTYEWIPDFDSPFASALGRGGGGTKDGEVNFLLANRIRKYGVPFDPKAFTAEMIFRVRKFGFNSTGAFGPGDNEARNEASFPYVAALPLSPAGGVPMLAREVWDPFDEKTRAAVEKNMARLSERANDPLLIGRFLANEPLFEDIPKLVPGYKEDKACKRRLVQMLEDKYKTVEAFNRAWGTNLASFAEAAQQALPVKTKEASDDMENFKNLFLEEYFKFTTDLMRKHDPHHLILGCRFQSGTINSESLCRIGSKYVDIWSFNYYTYGIDEDFLKKIVRWTGGKPMILSEFYWNSFADSGVAGGVKDVRSQQERGLAYRHYIEHAASLPFIVGAEWFTLLDASQTGVGFAKYSGENPNSGLFSVADRPWKPMIAEMIKTNYDIYKVAAGERERFVYDDPRFSGKAGRKNSVVASRVPSPLKIDGQGNDWPGMPAERIGSDRLAQGSDAAGFEAAFKLCWDDNHLYVLVDVSDKTPMKNDQPGPMLWSGDGLELFIGSEELDKGGQLLFTDRHILLSASAKEENRFHYLNAPEQYGCTMEVTPKEGGSGYILEAAIPWKALACQPEPNKEFLFDLAVDDSLNGTRRDKQLMWNGSSRNSGDRTHWGRFRLLGQ